jgi:hypothetical protein
MGYTEVVTDVAALVEYTPLHNGVLDEYALHPGAEGLAAVDDDQQALLESEAPVDERPRGASRPSRSRCRPPRRRRGSSCLWP